MFKNVQQSLEKEINDIKEAGLYKEERIIISYSKWDSSPTIVVYDKKKVDEGMF